MMTKGEVAAYLGMANVMMAEAMKSSNDEDNDIMDKVREALLQAQIWMTQEALKEVINNDGSGQEEA